MAKKKNKKFKMHPITGFIFLILVTIALSAILSLFNITASYDSVNLKTGELEETIVTVKNMITGVNILDATYTPAIKTNLINILLFNYSVSDGSASNNYMYGKMYGAKIYNNGTLIRNFVPAKNASGVVGMYDTVSGQFFTNQGEGSFIAGDPVAE